MLVCLDAAPDEALRTALGDMPGLAGVLYGAPHRWLSATAAFGGRLCPSLALPSAGAWGDIGHVLLRTEPDGAVAMLRQDGFRLLRELPPARLAADWRAAVAANQGGVCRFRWRTA